MVRDNNASKNYQYLGIHCHSSLPLFTTAHGHDSVNPVSLGIAAIVKEDSKENASI